MLVGCPPWKEEVMVGNAEGGLIEAASGAEVATEGASEEAEEATGEDLVLARWTQGGIAGRSDGADPTRSSEDKPLPPPVHTEPRPLLLYNR